MTTYKRHQCLVASEIRKLADESRRIDPTDEVLTRTMLSMERLVSERFSKGKRLDGGRLRSLLARIDDIFREQVRPIRFHSERVEPTRVHPKGDAYEVCYVGVKRRADSVPGFDTLYQLFSFRLYATRKKVVLALESLPYAFQYHAAERLMERAENVDSAFWQIACDLAEWVPLIKRGEYFATRHNGGEFHVPVMGTAGMLIGEFAPRVPSTSDRVTIMDGEGTSQGSRPRREGDQKGMYVGTTFINRFIMRPNQAYAMNLVSCWRDRFADELPPVVDDILWGSRFLTPQTVMSGEACASAVAIFDDGIVRRALHPDWKVNRIIESDWSLPLGRWAHEQYRKATEHGRITRAA